MRTVCFVVYEGFELLDMAGPSSVFRTANHLASQELYRVAAVATCGGIVSSWSGIQVNASAPPTVSSDQTVLVTGAVAGPLADALRDVALREYLMEAATSAERYGSICSGTFLLQGAGLLANRRVTTHWAGCEALAHAAPEASVDGDCLYVRDGRLWTSAGVTTGTDMALEMVAQDHGRGLSARIARQLVVYSHRPGYQSQFSEVLEAQARVPESFLGLSQWLRAQCHRKVSVAEMARRVHMTERTFQRRFREQTGTTPARFFERIRLDHARTLLEAGSPVKRIVGNAGFRSEAAFRRAFFERYGLTPTTHAKLHRQ